MIVNQTYKQSPQSDPDDLRIRDIVAHDPTPFPGSARAALIGVPQDIGVRRNNGRAGASGGPAAIRSMLYRLTPWDSATRSSLQDGFLYDVGDIPLPVGAQDDLETIHSTLEATVKGVIESGVIPIVLGGGHDITYAAARGVAGGHRRLGLVNLDAHLDVRPALPLRTSGTSIRMLIEEELIVAQNTVEFGIQGFVNAAAHVAWFEKSGGSMMTFDEIRLHGFHSSLASAIRVAGTDVDGIYATLDMDCVRASDSPGVSAPLPSGFSAEEFLDAAFILGQDSSVVALDIAEMNPLYDIDNRSARLAAGAILRFLAGLAGR